MQLHQARKANLTHKHKLRVGRGPGSGIGKTSGRGLKGATARSGYTMKASYEGGQMPLFRRLPKRGFRNGPFRETFSVVNVGELDGFSAGSKVGPAELREAGLIRRHRCLIKILGDGDLKIALNVSADAFTKSAIVKIEKAGGKTEWIGGAPKKPAPDFKKIEAEKKKAAAEKKPEGKGEGKGPKPEGGKPKAEGGKPKPEGGKPKAEGGQPKSEGGQPAAGGKPKAEGGKPAGEPKPAKAPQPPKPQAPPAQPADGENKNA
jgi:large subunit ribosomal protein L15